jgi:hypothetical protein
LGRFFVSIVSIAGKLSQRNEIEARYKESPAIYQLYAAPSACEMRCKGNHKQNQENHEQQFGYARGCNRYACKAQHSGDECDDQKYQRPIKHGGSSSGFKN